MQAVEFWGRVNRSGPPSDFRPDLGLCWLWTGAAVRSGARTYGYAHLAGSKSSYAHRIAYQLVHGPIPVGLEIDHLCRVTLCVNPRHLEAVTHQENVRRGMNGVLRALRRPNPPTPKRDICARGHARTAENVGTRRQCRICDRQLSLIRHERARALKKAS
jgi:hypothetical protein